MAGRTLFAAAVAALAALAALGTPAHAAFPGGGKYAGVVSASYTGPGDIAAGATGWWGLRAYSAATRGNKVANVCTTISSVDTCEDMFSDASTGNLDIITISGLSCASVSCNVKTLYDQTGHGYDLTQATIAARPILTPACIGALPCMVGSGAQTLTNAAFTSVSQPYTWSLIADWTGNFTAQQGIFAFAAGDAGIYYNNGGSPNTIAVYYGSTATTIATTENAFHAYQAVANGGGSSLLYVDGTSNTGSPGTNGSNTDVTLFSFTGPSNYLTGDIVEAGIWPTNFSSGTAAAMNSNQHAYWGF